MRARSIRYVAAVGSFVTAALVCALALAQEATQAPAAPAGAQRAVRVETARRAAAKPAPAGDAKPAPEAAVSSPPAQATEGTVAAQPPAVPPPVVEPPAVAPAHEEAAPAHGAAAHEGDHGAPHATGHHDAEEPPTFDDVNWFYGLLGESDEGETSLLYRPKGMPVPFLATLINWGILVALIVMLARKQVPAALAKRKAGIVQGMDDAKKARDESAKLLSEYEDKLSKIDRDIERIKDEMKRAGEQERERILAEAVERRSRMERDARRLIETELEAAKEALRLQVVQTALATAKKSIEGQLATGDQQRLFDEAMSSLKKLPARSLGGQA